MCSGDTPMRQEIRKRFAGRPSLWEAAVAVEDVKPYLLEFEGGLTPLSTSRERLLALVSTKSESAAHLQRDRKRLEQARAAQPTVTIGPNLVLYAPDDDAFYRFDRFTPQFAVFRFFRRNG